jgi:putative transposase
MSAPDRRARLDRDAKVLSIRRQCTLLGVTRSGVYRTRKPANDNDIALMRRLDEMFTAWPFLGSRRMAAMLRAEGESINRKRVQRLMRKIGVAALGPKPNTSKPALGHKIFPYLLRGLKIERPNFVWACDITYIPIGRGFLYLVAIIDWTSRAILSWRLSNTMDVSFCLAALEDALAKHGTPEIFNTDQGSQFTSAVFTGALATAGIRISMDGRGRWMDNVFIERVWRSLKYEDIYLKAYADGIEAKAGIGAWIDFYNNQRLHQALGYRTPMAVWRQDTAVVETVEMMDNATALTTSLRLQLPSASPSGASCRLRPQQEQKKTEPLPV